MSIPSARVFRYSAAAYPCFTPRHQNELNYTFLRTSQHLQTSLFTYSNHSAYLTTFFSVSPSPLDISNNEAPLNSPRQPISYTMIHFLHYRHLHFACYQTQLSLLEYVPKSLTMFYNSTTISPINKQSFTHNNININPFHPF